MYTGNNSTKQLKGVMQNELFTTLPIFTAESHPQCYHLYQTMREEVQCNGYDSLSLSENPRNTFLSIFQIFSIINTWSDIEYLYSNYISAQLSDIFVGKVKLLFSKYQDFPYNHDLRWLCDDIMQEEYAPQIGKESSYGKNAFWFFSETLDEDSYLPKTYPAYADPVRTLADWLFSGSVAELKVRAKILVESQNRNEFSTNNEMWTLHKDQLSAFLNVPIVNLELHLTLSSANALLVNFNISEGPHYYMPGSSITELQPTSTKEVTAAEAFEKSVAVSAATGAASRDAAGTETTPMEVYDHFVDETTLFGSIDAILDRFQNSRDDDEYSCKLVGIKSELEDFCDARLQNTESRRFSEPWKSAVETPMPKLQSRGKQEAQQQKPYEPCPNVQHKRRGRPRKLVQSRFNVSAFRRARILLFFLSLSRVDNFTETVPKTAQHKYSVEDVRVSTAHYIFT